MTPPQFMQPTTQAQAMPIKTTATPEQTTATTVMTTATDIRTSEPIRHVTPKGATSTNGISGPQLSSTANTVPSGDNKARSTSSHSSNDKSSGTTVSGTTMFGASATKAPFKDGRFEQVYSITRALLESANNTTGTFVS